MTAATAEAVREGVNWTLSLGDCLAPAGLAALDDRSVDHVICDPPYSAHVHACQRSGALATDAAQNFISRPRDLGFEHFAPRDVKTAARHIARVSRRWSAVFSDVESAYLWRVALVRSGAEYVRTLFWRKAGGAPQFTGDRPAVACEAITLCHPPGRKRWNGGGRQGFYDVAIAADRSGAGKRHHPTEKPVVLMEALVRDFTDPGELILDPFAGSGTTGVAALRLGRAFAGYERNPAHHATAAKRLGAAREQLDMFGSSR